MNALENLNYELIKAHVFDPSNSPLSTKHQEMLERVISAARTNDKSNSRKHAVTLHRAKYPHIKRTRAYLDVTFASRMFNSFHTFDFDFWHSWLINDIVKNIERSKRGKSPKDRLNIAKEHANLIKAIGEKPSEQEDPKRNEKHEFYIIAQLGKQNCKINIDDIGKLPLQSIQEFYKLLIGGETINEDDAKRIICS